MAPMSMTGHGAGSATVGALTVSVELNSVNRKQLDVVLGLPKSLGVLESRITDEIRKVVNRGRVSGAVAIDRAGGNRSREVEVDTELAAAYVKKFRKLGAELGLADDLSLGTLMAMPDVVSHRAVDENPEKVWPVLRRALRQALKRLVAMRRTEGKALGRDLRARLATCDRKVQRLKKLAPGMAAHYRAGLQKRLRSAGVSVVGADERLNRELAIWADRCDVAEELTRLESHLSQARTLLNSSEAIGRTLDFLAQEMFREINTIGSKANDAAVAKLVISYKTELERLREQALNVE